MWKIVALNPVPATVALVAGVILLYLLHLNRLLSGTPEEIRAISPRRWTPAEITETYARLREHPIDSKTHVAKLPPKIDRRYIVTGGSGK